MEGEGSVRRAFGDELEGSRRGGRYRHLVKCVPLCQMHMTAHDLVPHVYVLVKSVDRRVVHCNKTRNRFLTRKWSNASDDGFRILRLLVCLVMSL